MGNGKHHGVIQFAIRKFICTGYIIFTFNFFGVSQRVIDGLNLILKIKKIVQKIFSWLPEYY